MLHIICLISLCNYSVFNLCNSLKLCLNKSSSNIDTSWSFCYIHHFSFLSWDRLPIFDLIILVLFYSIASRLWLVKCCKSENFYYMFYIYVTVSFCYICHIYIICLITYLRYVYMYIKCFSILLHISIFTLFDFKFVW